jgi:hypothetical protein
MKDEWRYELGIAYLNTIRPIDFFIFALIYGLLNAVYFDRPVSPAEFSVVLVASVVAQVFVEYRRRRRRRMSLWYDLDDFIEAHSNPADRRERPLWLKSRE